MPDGVEKAFRIIGGLDRFWTRRGHFGLGHTALERAFAMPGAEAKTVHRASVLCTAGFIANVRGDPRSVAFLEESLALSRALEHNPIAVRALNSLGVCAIDRGEYSVAEAFLRESLDLSREIDDTRGVANALGNLGALAFVTKDYERARALFQEAVETFRIVGEIGGAVTYLGGISRSSLFVGDVETARDALVQSVSMIEKLGDKRNGATALLTAGLLAVRMKDHRSGAQLLAAGEALRATFTASGALLAPSDKALRDEAVAEIREALGEAGFDRAWAEGHALDFQGALRAVSEFASSPPAARTKGVLREASS
jgi:tetratricopeptide (TPR) repeat protein